MGEMGAYTGSFQKVQEMAFLWLVPFFPLLGAAVNGILGKKIQDRFGKRANPALPIGALPRAPAPAPSLPFAGPPLPAPAGARTFRDLVFPMIHIGRLHVDFALTMDQLSGVMTLIITLIGAGIHVYSVGYMAEEPATWPFFSHLNLFVFSR